MFSKVLLVMTLTALAVNAQTIPGLTPCVLACVQPAAAQNGCSFTDPSCVCTSAQFQADAGACLTEHCSAADVQGAMALQQAQCAAANLSATGSATPRPVSFTTPPATPTGPTSGTAATTAPGPATTTRAPPSTATGAATTPSPTTTNGALSAVAQSGMGALAAVLVAGYVMI